MADFVEIWSLRNKLILDGLYDPTDQVDGLAIERNIVNLAKKHYGYEPLEPRHLELEGRVKSWIESMTLRERLDVIHDILVDYDGFRTARGLAGLIDEVNAYVCHPVARKEEDLTYWKEFWALRDDIENWLDENVLPRINQTEAYTITIKSSLMHEAREWAESKNLEAIIFNVHLQYDLIDVRIEKNESI